MAEVGNEMIGAVNYMKKKGKLKIVALGFAVGVALLLLGSIAFEKKETVIAESAATNSYEAFLEYKEGLRLEIEGLCRSVDGVGNVHAVVFFDGIGESVYAQNTQSGNTEKSEYVVIGSGSSSHALYLGESLPKLSGIGVVCDTGGRDNVKNELAALLSAAYGLPLTRVYVSEGR